MNARGKLPVIPTPVALRVRQVRMTVLPSLVLAGSVAILALLWQDRVGTIAAPGWPPNLSSRQVGAVVQAQIPVAQRLVGGAPILQPGSQFETSPLAMQSSLKIAGTGMVLPAPVSIPADSQLHAGKLTDLNRILTTD